MHMRVGMPDLLCMTWIYGLRLEHKLPESVNGLQVVPMWYTVFASGVHQILVAS